MHKPLQNLPPFDAAGFVQSLASWKESPNKTPGNDRIVIEWGVSKGTSVFVYPGGDRGAGVQVVENRPGQSDERWADFLEYEYVPHVAAVVEREGLRPQIICVDLRPLQIQRERRRKLEQIAHEKTGAEFHHPTGRVRILGAQEGGTVAVEVPGTGGLHAVSETVRDTAITPHTMEAGQ